MRRRPVRVSDAFTGSFVVGLTGKNAIRSHYWPIALATFLATSVGDMHLAPKAVTTTPCAQVVGSWTDRRMRGHVWQRSPTRAAQGQDRADRHRVHTVSRSRSGPMAGVIR